MPGAESLRVPQQREIKKRRDMPHLARRVDVTDGGGMKNVCAPERDQSRRDSAGPNHFAIKCAQGALGLAKTGVRQAQAELEELQVRRRQFAQAGEEPAHVTRRPRLPDVQTVGVNRNPQHYTSAGSGSSTVSAIVSWMSSGRRTP